MKVLVAESISNEGIDILRSSAQVDIKLGLKPEEILSAIGDYEALIVRSQIKVSAEVIAAGKKLQVIARAGVGIDNIDVEEATRRGIVVVNAPTGNTISAAEHTIALMLSLARHIPQANAVLKSGVWCRKDFIGVEVRNKTLGIIGLGNVGSEVARRALGLEMRLIAYDPFISVDYAHNLQVEMLSLKQLLEQSDFITLHLPLTASTRTLIGAEELTLVKPSVRIINTARGGLIDEKALAKAVNEKRVAGAAIDVFSSEPVTDSAFFENDSIIVTPHLGASTAEAQAMTAIDIAKQIIDVFNRQPARYAVNTPFISVEALAVLTPFMKVASLVSELASQLTEGQMNDIRIKYAGDISSYDTSALKAATLGGLLEGISDERVNLVNANIVAVRRGLAVVEQKEAVCENYASLITLEVTTSTGVTTVAGTVMRGEPHIVQIGSYWIDIVPSGGYFLFTDHLDRPGIISAVSKVTSNGDVNINSMHVGRLKARGHAIMVVDLDAPLSEGQLEQIRSIPDVYSAKLVKL